MSSSDDELVNRYLARLDNAASGMPADRRRELIDEIITHIEEAMAARPAPPGGVATVLDQLGSPEEIVRAAQAGPAGARPGPGGPLGAVEIVAIIGLLIGGIILPVVGWLVGVVLLWISPRWKAGDKLLATLVWPGGLLAPVVAFLVLGAAALFTVGSVCVGGGAEVSGILSGGRTVTEHASSGVRCTPPPIPPWLAIALAAVVMVAAVAGPILVAVRLIRQAHRAVATPEAESDLLTTPLPA